MTDTISGHVADYLDMRRGLGYRMVRQARSLRSFAADLDRRGHDGPVPLGVTLDWAGSTTSPDPRNPARRLSSVRGFLRYLAVLDGATDIPAVGLFGPTTRRTPPHVYSDAEIAELMAATATLHPTGGIRPHCYRTLFGLLACSGLRISEALALQCADVDLPGALLTVRAGKGGRTRLVPLHPTAVTPLAAYTAERVDRYGPAQPQAWFFRTDASQRVSYEGAFGTFARLRRQLGWTADGRARTPRIHDLRHRMVVRRIQAWHAAGVDVDAHLPALATYLGHANIADLYWYFSAVPELMSIVADRFEHDGNQPEPAGAR